MITDEQPQAAETPENDFAAFEAIANATEPQPEETQPKAEAAPVEDDKADDAPEANDDGDSEGEEDQPEGEEQPKKRRSKPASERIAELTARLRETERALEAERQGRNPAEVKEPTKPNPDDFEFGESDPDYQDALVDYKLEVKEAEKAKETAVEQQRNAALQRVNDGVALAAETAKAKYEDFETVVAEAAEARGGVPLPQLLTMGIGLSPVGGDLIYRLATDEATSEKMEKVAQTGGPAFALALGELEGEYLDDETDSDLDLTDQIDVVRKMGRMNARLRALRGSGGQTAPKRAPAITNAPEPPKQRIRGGNGQFGTPPDTTDFAAFEKLASAAR